MEAQEKMQLQGSDVDETSSRKPSLFKASIGGARPLLSQPHDTTLNQGNMEDLDGQSTPAGPMPKSKGGPVPLMSLEVKPPSPHEDVDQDPESTQEGDSSILPKALEQALALKSERAHEMGVHQEYIAQVSKLETSNLGRDLISILLS